MSAEIIRLPYSVTRGAHSRKTRRLELPETGRQRAGRRSRNPLRQHLRKVEHALVIAGKLHRNEPLSEYDDVSYLNDGIAAARLLAEQLDLVVKRWKSAP